MLSCDRSCFFPVARRIRALERVHREHVKVFDPTESGGHGLLEEMSLVELRERLQINEIREKEMVQDRRQPVKILQSTFTHLECGHRPSQALNSADRISAPL